MSKPKLVEGLQLEIYVVVTTMDDNMADVILITSDKDKAEEIAAKITNREPIEGFDYDLLSDYEDAQYFTRSLNSLKNWQKDSDS